MPTATRWPALAACPARRLNSRLSLPARSNVLDATKAYKKLLTDKADVEGLPESGESDRR